MDDDAELVDRLRSGDERAFVELVDRYQGRLLRLAQATVGRRAVAEEVTQDTWLAVVRGLERFEGRSSFKTWLFGVIRLTALDQRRRDWRRWLRFLPLDEAAEKAAPHAAAPGPRLDAVRRALAELTTRQAEVLRLVFYHELTLDEAAAAMGVSPGTARTHYERGKQRLRDRLTGAPR